MKKFSLLLIMAFVSVTAWAVRAKQGVFTYRQSDGSDITVELVGDEYFHYYVNTATGEKVELGADGKFRAIDRAAMQSRITRGELRRADVNEERIQRLPRMQQMATPDGKRKAIGSFSNMTGQKKGLVILVNFQDVKFKTANNQAAFDNQFNKSGYSANSHIGSVKDYFLAQSYGAFSIDFDVVGPVTVSQNMAYYGANDDGGSDVHPAEMIIEAVKLADAAGVDFTKYDWGGNGSVDQVFVVYAGYAEAQGASANTIWPHQWTLSSAKVYGDGSGSQRIDGKTINQYACTAELCGNSGSTMDGIGTACHEFSHCLGYPDFYDTEGGDCWGMDAFDLMDYGSYCGPNQHGEVPTGYSAYERWMAGWLEPIELKPGDHETISTMAALNDSPIAYIIYNDNKSSEYLLLENRQNKGWFRYLRSKTSGHGLLVTHVDYLASSWSSNSVNTDTSHERFKYIAADKSYTTSSTPNDYFGSVSKVTQLTSTSHSSFGGKWFNNTKAGNKNFADMDITNIAESNGQISFDFNGGAPADDGSRYTITYWINGVRSQWTQTEYRQSTIIKTIPEDFSDWFPMGWSTTDYTGIVPAGNAEFVPGIIEGQSYIPTEDITIYAVYADESVENCTSHPVETNNTITLNVLGSTYQTWSQSSGSRTFTLPALTTPVSGWNFIGWATTDVPNTTTKPSLLVAGTVLRPNVDVTYYAVFSSKVGQGGGSSYYRLVDAPEAGGVYVVATSNAAGSAYALDATKVSSTAAQTISATGVTIVDNSGMSIADPDDALLWTASYTNNKWQLKNDDNYLVINGSGFSTKTTSSDLYWSNSYGLYGKSGSGYTSYYVYGEGAQLTTKQSGTAAKRVYLYQGGGSVTYYSTTPAEQDYTITFDAGAGSCATASFVQNHASDIVSTTLPAATIALSGWSFAGWSTEAIANTTTKPTLLAAGAQYTPLFNQTLYAVYSAIAYNGAQKLTYYSTSPTESPVSTFYTVTLRNGTGAGSSQLGSTWTQSASAPSFTFPTPVETYEGWTFYGWSASPVAQTLDAPAVLAPGASYTPTANTTFYSVYVNAKPAYISNPDRYLPGGGTADPQFYFPHIATLGKPFVEPRFHSDSEGALHFSSSNTAVATVDPVTGKVTPVAAGTAIITVEQEATATHKATSASYMIKVVE